jgi:cell division protein FtsB
MTKSKMETKALKRNKKKILCIKNLNIFLVSTIIVVGFVYIFSINELIAKGFKLNELKKELNKISEENAEYNLKILSLESYNNLSKRAADLKMVAVEEIAYITVKNNVALK